MEKQLKEAFDEIDRQLEEIRREREKIARELDDSPYCKMCHGKKYIYGKTEVIECPACEGIGRG